MKQAEYIKRSLAGERLIIVEFRKTVGDEIRRKVVKAGEASVMPMAKHTVLSNDTSYEVAQFLPDGADVKQVKPPYEKGTRVVFALEGMEQTKWGTRMTGEFHGPLEA